MRIKRPVRGNRKLRTVLDRVNDDDQLKGWWHVQNVNAIARLGINDHSWVHIQIVTNIALKLLRQLVKSGVEPSLARDYGLTADDSEVVVALSALLHDIGMSVHRKEHEDFSLFLAEPKLRELLTGVYEEPDLTVIVSEVLQAIISHRADGQPLALGRVSMHSLSAAAIESVSIEAGESRPVKLEITMNNSSGIFQVDELLKAKLKGSGLEPDGEGIAHN